MRDERDTEIVLSEQELKQLPTGYLSSNRETGWKTLRGKPETALRCFHTAAAAFPEDIRTLVGRGKARQQLRLLNTADQDAQKILELNNFDKDAILLQAQCQLGLGNFEEALVMYNRGVNKRGRRKEFLDGKSAVKGVLENSIGQYAGPVLTKFDPIIQKIIKKEKKNKKLNDHQDMNSNCLEELSRKPIYNCTLEQWRRNEKIVECRNEELCKVYLERIVDDHKWCKSLASCTSDPNLKQNAEMALKQTNRQLELSKNQKPTYYMQNKSYYPIMTLENRRVSNINYQIKLQNIHRLFENLKKFKKQQENKNCFYDAYKIKTILNSLPNHFLSVKLHYLGKLCNFMGFLYLDDLKINDNLSFEENRQRIDLILGFQSLHNNGWCELAVKKSKFPFFNSTNWMKNYKEQLETAENDLEKCCLHYEISRCYLLQKKLEYSIVEANKSVGLTHLSENLVWRINALFLVVISQCYLKNRDEALETLQECIECAFKLQNETVLKFLNETKLVLESKCDDSFYVSVDKILEKRQRAIIRLQKDSISKERAEDLLSRINFLPLERRLVLVPGIKPSENQIFSKNKSIIRGGSGGRLGLHPVTNKTYFQFCDVLKI